MKNRLGKGKKKPGKCRVYKKLATTYFSTFRQYHWRWRA